MSKLRRKIKRSQLSLFLRRIIRKRNYYIKWISETWYMRETVFSYYKWRYKNGLRTDIKHKEEIDKNKWSITRKLTFSQNHETLFYKICIDCTNDFETYQNCETRCIVCHMKFYGYDVNKEQEVKQIV